MFFEKKFRFAIFLLGVFVLPVFAKEEFYETDDLAHILPYIDGDTLVVFDLDNTLVRTKQTLGSDEWFVHKVQDLIQKGHTHLEASTNTLAVWAEVLKRSDLCFMQDVAQALIHDLQEQNIPVMALTKRDPAMASRTLQQLADLGVDFSKTSPFTEDLVFSHLASSLYQRGVAFTAFSTGKGLVLEELLKQIQAKPKKIIFIDDKQKYVDDVAESSRKLKIDYVGIRYSRADERIENFNPGIADMQLKKFNSILSDEEAHHLLVKLQEEESSLLIPQQSKNDR